MSGGHLAPISRRLLAIFAAVLALVVGILFWWIFFNVRSAGQQRDDALARSEAQRVLAAEMVGLAAALHAPRPILPEPPEVVDLLELPAEVLRRSFPALAWEAPAAPGAPGRIVVRAEVRAQIDALHASRVRMFLSEGGFFLAMVLLGALLIVRAMRREVSMTRSQANFVSAVTHELKSPLASIRLYVETMLLREVLPADRGRYLHIMRDDVDRLEGLVGNLLAVARLDAAPRAAALEQVDLSAEVMRITAPLLAEMAARGAPCAVHPADGPVPVRVDVGALQAALRNLLDNAAKYGRNARPIEVAVGREAGAAVCAVRDYGIGIAAGELDKIFGKFYRVGDELVRQSEGSGLGLFLARALLEPAGGTVRAASAGLGCGAQFVIRLPLSAAAGAA